MLHGRRMKRNASFHCTWRASGDNAKELYLHSCSGMGIGFEFCKTDNNGIVRFLFHIALIKSPPGRSLRSCELYKCLLACWLLVLSQLDPGMGTCNAAAPFRHEQVGRINGSTSTAANEWSPGAVPYDYENVRIPSFMAIHCQAISPITCNQIY